MSLRVRHSALPLLLTASLCFGQSEASVEVQEEVRAVLLELVGHEEQLEEVSRRLAQAGDAAVLAGVLTDGRLPSAEGPGPPLRPIQEQALLEAFGHLDHGDTDSFLREQVKGSIGPRRRGVLLRVLGEIGTREDLPLFLQLAAPDGTTTTIAHEVLDAYRAGLGRLLHRRSRAVHALLRGFWELPPELLVPAVQALGAGAPVVALEAFRDFLGRDARLDPFLLREMRGILARRPELVSENLFASFRDQLHADAPSALFEAILACEQTEDTEAIPELIELLEDTGPGVASAAERALRHITREAHGSDHERWWRWYQDQEAWWTSDAQPWIELLGSPELVDVAAALNRLSTRRSHRHLLVHELSTLLQRPDPQVVRLACLALGRLSSPLAIPELRECLVHDAPMVREAARRALFEISRETSSPSRPLFSNRAQENS